MTREEWEKLTPDARWAKYIECATLLVESLGKGFEILNYHIARFPFYITPVHAQTREEMIRERLLDPDGNPPPALLYGDMRPIWYDGRWWVSHAEYVERKRQNGVQS